MLTETDSRVGLSPICCVYASILLSETVTRLQTEGFERKGIVGDMTGEGRRLKRNGAIDLLEANTGEGSSWINPNHLHRLSIFPVAGKKLAQTRRTGKDTDKTC